MKKLILCIGLFITVLPGIAQKKVIDHSVYGTWAGSDRSTFGNTLISQDGRYIVYFVGATISGFTMTIQVIGGTWKKEVAGVRSASLIGEDRYLVYRLPSDTLVLFDLKYKIAETIAGVKSFKVPKSKLSSWFVYLLKDGNVVIKNVSSSVEKRFDHVGDYYFNSLGSQLLLYRAKSDIAADFTLTAINIEDFSSHVIYKGMGSVEGLSYDESGKRIAFFAKVENKDANSYKLMYYTVGMDSAIPIVKDRMEGLNPDLKICPWPAAKFSNEGKRLFFSMRTPEAIGNNEGGVKVDVWHYLDQRLQTEQQKKVGLVESLQAVFNLDDKTASMINHIDDDLYSTKLSAGGDGAYALVFSDVNQNEKFWNALNKPNIYLVSLKDGTRKIILKGISSVEVSDINFSPGGNYVVWSDRATKRYYTLNVHSGVTKDITTAIPESLFGENTFPSYPLPYGVAAWGNLDSTVFIYDQFDIWQVDPEGFKRPVNITNHFGRKQRLMLRLEPINTSHGVMPIIALGDTILLKSYNLSNWDYGFFHLKYGKQGSTVRLLSGGYDFSMVCKSTGASVYIIKRVNSAEAPNLFWTQSFQQLYPISDIQPQKEYNWMTAEQIRWKTFDGKEDMGILYKPENFDPKKKYPVIVNFYQYPGPLHNFRYPEPSNGEINIPYFVSNGYIVFRPGILFNIGKPGYSAYNSIVSGVNYLSRNSWFDSTRMGLSGISYGGYEINYLVTQTNIFAAAAPAAGMTDLVSDYNGIWTEMSKEFMYETSQGRIGATLWDKPDLYVQNSPIFRANKVQTPLLIQHNKEDEAVGWSQGVEWFNALRRLGKRAWMLQYDGEQHGLGGFENKVDYSIRLAQFFDHYLKGKHVPLWMSKGIPAKMKGKETGLEMDSTGSCGMNCRICKQIRLSLNKNAR